MKYFTIIFFIILISCNSKQEIDSTKTVNHTNNDTSISKNIKADSLNTYVIETFIDSISIGEKGKCKIELIRNVVNNDYKKIIIKFYVKSKKPLKENKTWIIKNNYTYETNSFEELNPNISDFNNDKFNDINFISAQAVRDSNQVRRLFIYDPKKQELIAIVNSEDYPNMLYNKELDCIDAFFIHGTTTTEFAKISGDSLKTFASVDNCIDFQTISLIDKNGIKRELYKVKTKKVYVRHKNFKPLIEYPNY
jgi:hypothetical protein